MLDAASLAAASLRYGVPPIGLVACTGSTNSDVAALARAGAPHGTALFALEQTAGRGRLGRTWASPPGANVLMSVLLRPQVPLERVALACLGAAAVVALVAGDAFRIKWPNDVLAPDGRKVAGILAEVEADGGVVRHLVVGVGLNVRAAPPLPTATCLFDVDGEERAPAELAASIVRGLLDMCDDLARAPADVLVRWRRRAHTLGKRVRVGAVEGEAVDVDPSGALVVRTDDGAFQRILAGDVEMVARLP